MVMLAKPILPRPKLVVAPRNPNEGFIQGGLNSATPTPMIFGSSLYADRDPYTDYKPFSSLLAEALGSPSFAPMDFINNSVNKRTVTDMPTSNEDEKPAEIELNGMGGDHVYSQSISSARYKSMVPSRLPIASSSPHFTISPGISPASLLESPILFCIGQTDLSPTTGSFSTPPTTNERELLNNASMAEDSAKSPERNDSFIFKPHPLVGSYGSPAEVSMGTFGMQAEETSKHSDGQWQPYVGSEELYSDEIPASDWQASSPSSGVQDNLELMNMASAAIQPPDTGPTSYVSGVTNYSNGRLSIDEYHWKKYGQKTLKNSENPRSYYKCTHPDCPAKRLVECSLEGKITEITYKAGHNHAKPEGNRRRAKNANSVVPNSEGTHHDCFVQDTMGVRKMNEKALGDLSSSSFVLSLGGLPGTPELSFTSPSNEDDENGEAGMAEDDNDEAEYHSKLRRIDSENENFPRESLRTAREPRVVVQTVSEKDILDDGYRWRKYGQKVVKGHHYPRNYYKCTNIGCTVRKQVERSSSDTKSVMTTYEGKHNHSVPPARGSMREKEEAATAHPALQTHGGSEANSYVF